MKISLSLFATAIIALAALPAQAQSVAKPGHQCDALADEATPELVCQNMDAGSLKVTFYFDEFQDCDGGNIKNLDKDTSALITRSASDVGDYVDTVSNSSDIQVTYAKSRTHMDWLAGDTTMQMPTSAVIKDKSNTFKVEISSQLQPDYDGALDDDVNFKGSYTEVDSGGRQIASGQLSCFVNY